MPWGAHVSLLGDAIGYADGSMPKPTITADIAGDGARRNGLYIGVDLALFMAALGLLGPTTIVPLFVSKLTSDPLAIGVLAAVFHLGWLPQLFSAGYVERSERKLPALIRFTILERIPSLGMALCALAAVTGPDGSLAVTLPLLLGGVYLCRFAQSVASGLSVPPWMDVIARVVPDARRGRFMANWTMLGNALGIGTAALAAPLLEWLPFPYGFAACFGLAFVILFAGMIPIFLITEPAGAPPRAAAPFRQHLGELGAVLRDDAAFRSYLVGLALAAVGSMATSFLIVYAAQRLGASDELAAWYTVVLLAASVVANPPLGWLADRWGFAAVGQVTALAGIGIAAGAILTADPLWLVVPFALVGAGQSGAMLARMTGPIEFAPVDRRPTYVALSNGLVSLAAAVAPLIGSQILAWMGYEALFIVSAACSALAVWALRGRGSSSKSKLQSGDGVASSWSLES